MNIAIGRGLGLTGDELAVPVTAAMLLRVQRLIRWDGGGGRSGSSSVARTI